MMHCKKKMIIIRQVASLIGKVNTTAPTNPVAALYTKNLENEKIQALCEEKFNYDAYMSLSVKSKTDLYWLKDNLKNSSAPIRLPKQDFVTYTDASCEGWCCHNPQTGKKTGGRWSIEEQRDHINTHELRAIWFSLLTFAKMKTGGHVRIMTDNTTALTSVNKQGSTRSQMQNNITRRIWDLALEKKFWIPAAHVPGKENIEADEASRIFKDRTEWSLRKSLSHSLEFRALIYLHQG